MPDNNDERDGKAFSTVTQEEEEEASEFLGEFLKNPFNRTPQEQREAEEDLEQWEAEQREKAKSTDSTAARRTLWSNPSAEPNTSTDPDQHDGASEGDVRSQGEHEDQSRQANASGQSLQATESSTAAFKPRRSPRIAEQNSSVGK